MCERMVCVRAYGVCPSVSVWCVSECVVCSCERAFVRVVSMCSLCPCVIYPCVSVVFVHVCTCGKSVW